MTWLDTLGARVAATSQRQVASELDLSTTTISLVLSGRYPASTQAIEAKVLRAYADPVWLTALRDEAKRTSGARVAQRIGVSEATVSQVLNGSYKANTLRIERRVRGELLGETCECPVLFELSLRACQAVQERARNAIANPMHQQEWYACRGEGRFDNAGPCPHFNCGATKPAAPKE
jgi:transcriptional regulator with XRE-family HTH domain